MSNAKRICLIVGCASEHIMASEHGSTDDSSDGIVAGTAVGIGTRGIGTRGIGTRGIGTRGIGTRGIGTRGIGTRGIGTRAPSAAADPLQAETSAAASAHGEPSEVGGATDRSAPGGGSGEHVATNTAGNGGPPVDGKKDAGKKIAAGTRGGIAAADLKETSKPRTALWVALVCILAVIVISISLRYR